MAYASKYYNPKKAHEYYLRTRELKGYENRYGGARGDGTSVASGMPMPEEKKSSASASMTYSDGSTNGRSSSSMTYSNGSTNGRSSSASMTYADETKKSKTSSYRANSGKIAGQTVQRKYTGSSSGATIWGEYTIRESTGDDALDELIEKYDAVKAGWNALKKEHKSGIDALRKDLKNLSREDKVSFREAIDHNKNLSKQDQDSAKKEMAELKAAIKKRREEIREEKKRQKELQKEQKQKDKEAGLYIKNQMDIERDETIKKVNKSVDDEMLTEVKRFADNLKKRRQNGEKIDNKVLLSQIKSLSGRAKKSKIKHKKRYVDEYKTKYKEEMERYYQNR